MNKVLITALLLGLLLAGCGASAATQESSVAPQASVAEVEAPPADAAESGQPPERGERPERTEENAIAGKITAITDSEITLELASVSRPQRGGPGRRGEGSLPDGDAAPEPPETSGDTATQPAPEREGRRPGGGMGGTLEYTGETAAYPLADGYTIHSAGPDESATETAELAAGDIVRLTLDDDGKVTVISPIAGSISGGEATGESQ